jgi:hypothetical protein
MFDQETIFNDCSSFAISSYVPTIFYKHNCFLIIYGVFSIFLSFKRTSFAAK